MDGLPESLLGCFRADLERQLQDDPSPEGEARHEAFRGLIDAIGKTPVGALGELPTATLPDYQKNLLLHLGARLIYLFEVLHQPLTAAEAVFIGPDFAKVVH